MAAYPQASTPASVPACRPAQAFTLVELLTVIAIIGILGAIMIPVVSSVRKSAQGTQCMANLRSLQVASSLYVSEWKHWPTYNQEHGTNPAASGTHRFFIPLIKLGYLPSKLEIRDGIEYQIADAFLCPANTDNPGSAYPYISPKMWFPNYAMSTLWNGPDNRGIYANVVTNSNAILFVDTQINPMGGSAIYVPANVDWSSKNCVIPRDLHGHGAQAVLINGAVISITPQSYPDLGDKKYWDPIYTAQ